MQFACQLIPFGKYNILQYDAKVKMGRTGYVQVIIESKDGKFYMAKKYISISIGGGDP